MKKINVKTARANKINHSTEMVFILDRSGSMAGLESDTIGGFNAMIEKQKKQSGKAYVSTVLFDTSTTVLHDRAELNTVKPMTADDYSAGGCTALLDAIGGAINHIGNIHKYARPEDIPAHTIFVITTERSGKRKPSLQQERYKTYDRATEIKIRLGISLYRSKYRRNSHSRIFRYRTIKSRKLSRR